MGTMYVFEHDVYISKEGGELKVSRRKGREVLMRKPTIHVSELVLFGNAIVTPSALYPLLEQGSSVHYITRGGSYFGHIAPQENKNVPLRIQQYKAYLDEEWKHTLARSFVLAKVQNAIVFAKRSGADVTSLSDAIRDIERCDNTESLRGLEGNAARNYFALIKHKFPEAFAPESRTKRPPRDIANSVLSLAYTFLAKECQNAIRIAGLEPYIGYLHEPKYGKPALALDLMEEFRSIIADSVVLSLFNKNMLNETHFHTDDGFPKCTDEGFKQFLRAWEERLSQTVRHPHLKQKLNYRQVMTAQARILGKHLMGELPEYKAFTVR